MMAPVGWQVEATQAGVWIAALLSMFGALVTSYFTYRGNRAKASTDLTISERQAINEAAEKLRQGLVDEIERLRAENAELRSEIEYQGRRQDWQERVNARMRAVLRDKGVDILDLALPEDPRREGLT